MRRKVVRRAVAAIMGDLALTLAKAAALAAAAERAVGAGETGRAVEELFGLEPLLHRRARDGADEV